MHYPGKQMVWVMHLISTFFCNVHHCMQEHVGTLSSQLDDWCTESRACCRDEWLADIKMASGNPALWQIHSGSC